MAEFSASYVSPRLGKICRCWRAQNAGGERRRRPFARNYKAWNGTDAGPDPGASRRLGPAQGIEAWTQRPVRGAQGPVLLVPSPGEVRTLDWAPAARSDRPFTHIPGRVRGDWKPVFWFPEDGGAKTGRPGGDWAQLQSPGPGPAWPDSFPPVLARCGSLQS